MKQLSITQNGVTFVAVSSETDDEMHNLTGSILELWLGASDLLKGDPEDSSKFVWGEFMYRSDKFQASWNAPLNGYVIIFSDGKRAQTQTYTNTDRLDADFGQEYLERYTEFDDNLNENQESLVNEFIDQVNRLKNRYS